METTELVADYLIIFTKSAISGLKLNTNPELRNTLTNACINFRHFSAQYAAKALFTIFYGEKVKREEILRKLFKDVSSMENIFETPTQNIPNFSEEEFQILANELFHQYSAAHPDFLVVETNCPEYEKELNVLKESMSAHPVLLYRAVEMCKLVCHAENMVLPCVSLLASKSTHCQLSGLEMIGHNFQHRVLLLPFAQNIGLLLQAMYNAKESSSMISPFTIWLNQHSESKFASNSNTPTVPRALPQYLLLEEFKKFINNDSELFNTLPRFEELRQCLKLFKTDLGSLLENKEYLHLTKAIVTLFYAKKSYWEAQEDFALGDKESLLTVSKMIQKWENAKHSYNSALDNFIASCKS